MAGKKAAMTPTQIRDAGFTIEAYVPVGANEHTRQNPWIIRRRGDSATMWSRFATRDEAIAMLQEELASPDSTWRQS